MMRFFTFIALLLLLVPSNAAISSQMVETLPGFPGKLPFKLETGYVGVGDSDSVQLFYYFVESERDPDEDPLILWLTGGPGCSGFYAFVYEVGPLLFDYAKSSSGRVKVPVLKLNPYSWTKVSNIIFIDAPVGTGFSYATNSEAYVVDDILSATQTSEFLRKWLLSHPRFLKNPLYISGDSYSGIIVPILVKMISDDNDAGIKPRMNLKGYSIGNPITNEVVDENWRVPFAQRLGLLPDKLYESTKRDCRGKYVDVDPSNAACLGDLEVYTQNLIVLVIRQNQWDGTNQHYPSGILISSKRIPWSFFPPSIILNHGVGHITMSSVIFGLMTKMFRMPSTFGRYQGTKKWWPRCNNSLAYTESVPSTVPYHKNLTNKAFAVLIYSGDHDMVAPYVGTLAWVRSLNLTESSKWRPWYVQGQVGGYTVEYTHNNNYSLTYATVKGAGHTAPEYKPEDCYAMFTRWIARLPL
ncbi:serine carboxypeptidase-like 17 isoform X2 [Prosopis cineraria]|uniref:serine carboxypeptidase-like 17 isoform X2 n=1 Tax=Prosopis cineraria TaxID=364024 RepID=UPI00240EF0FA|nr:serine carboxypeptidase-like 17 isoform X2 [Prosopis cineraria]